MTAMPFEESRAAFLSAGAQDYVVKPFDNATFERIRRRLAALFPQLGNGAAPAEVSARRSTP